MFEQQLENLYQDLAYKLALQGKISCYPNPAVGCLIVKDQQIISLGFHKFAGTAHAERAAVLSLKERYPETWQDLIKGATAYVTLEPCAHFGRTPPCANLLADCQVKKVVYLSADSTDKVNGKGVAILERAGIQVEFVPSAKCEKLNQDFFALQQQERELPFIKIKIGASLDSKVALPNGNSKWITSPEARSYVQGLRWQADAILASAKTVIVDKAKYNLRYAEFPQIIQEHLAPEEVISPKLVLLDNSQQLTGSEEVFAHHKREDIVIVSCQPHPLASAKEFAPSKFISGFDSHKPEQLKEILKQLKALGINNLLVETGSSLTNALIENRLFDQLHYFMAPKVLGSGLEALRQEVEQTQIADCLQLNLLYSQELSEDNLYLVYAK
ncbi:riboflavin biosynthesis protein RibD [Psittacicella hinzii]|uniref:Riboflavin biosynthesis protein RibD n=1 Tax=Psittacicella hinzii TaxID=2028575 RepID=A0A3A1Y5C4_9GAMM|nr:bifunctional diaminohydroxyphosphoribosylaminopyrimidine deaminase/5-amino-6-(5-phosphoribosylamino)uracil reductase RibD [Psittacicella hinzii]RIY33453.1 riboflavin biosynthesis protein RibD [Psittacicella hinzii]